MKTWWINNNWRFWGWQWAFGNEDSAFTGWQEYRYMLNPDDERSLTELIIEEYEADVDRIIGNPLISFVWWVQRVGRKLRSLFTKIEPPF